MSDIPASGPATLDDVSRATGIRRQRLTLAVANGDDVPLKKIGGRWYSRHEWIRAWIETGTFNPNRIERAPEPVRADEI